MAQTTTETVQPTKVLLVAVGLVGASTAILPTVGGYGTILFQVVALGAWGIVAAVTSGLYADTHHPVVWSVAFFLNVVLFIVPAGIIWLAGRRRWPVGSSAVISAWCAFYLASLFLLFPATDGP
jgi:hypothetical protein